MFLNLSFFGLAVVSLATPLSTKSSGLGNIHHGDIIHSLSLPGFQFRRVKPLTTVATERKIQNHLELRRLPRGDAPTSQRSAAALFGQIQRNSGGNGYENVSAVNHYAVEYSVRAFFNKISMDVIIDSGSADTWVRAPDFICRNNLNKTLPQETCGLGPSFAGNFTGRPIHDQHFTVKYGDGESVQGRLGYMDVAFAGINVFRQEIALATQGTWHGNNVTSGVLGLAYPSLTNAYWGNDLNNDDQYLSAPYSPLFTSMVRKGLTAPCWAIALARNSSLGSISIGGMPPVDISKSDYDTTPILILDIIHRDSTNWQPSFYTVVPTGFHFGQTTVHGQYPFILDTATTLIYLPPDMADAVNAQFDPPAIYFGYYGSYFTNCDATPPSFGVQIGETIFWVNPKDLINTEDRDPDTGLCQTGINNGGTGPYILGITFLTNVVVSMDVGSGQVGFWSHQFY
ncbi:acid protease [Hypoxylon trugodes]|uniref:acid protease n=1 Tax=Hypoxylon trugodes TaxID=326681 RepID=UPI0021906907|nr:acid protease [Hypoxylon trugodes]KAI1382743.1 acid protease [Hypoxylon trugodes]